MTRVVELPSTPKNVTALLEVIDLDAGVASLSEVESQKDNPYVPYS